MIPEAEALAAPMADGGGTVGAAVVGGGRHEGGVARGDVSNGFLV